MYAHLNPTRMRTIGALAANSVGGWPANVLHAVPPDGDDIRQAEKRGTPAHQRLQRSLWGERGVPIDKAVALSQT